MTVRYTPEQEDLRAVLRELMGEYVTEERVRAVMDDAPGVDEKLWALLAEMGLLGLGFDEAAGGSGGTVVDLCLVVEELGRALACVPYLSSVVLAGGVLSRVAEQDLAVSWLPRLLSGETRGAVAFVEDDGDWTFAEVTTRAELDEQGRWRLSGRKCFVVDGHTADVLLVLALTGVGPTLFLVEAGAEGVSRRRLRTLDRTRPLASIDLDGAEAVRIDAEGGALAVLGEVLDLARVAVAAECVGGAQHVLKMAVDYLTLREQFGRPIGSFQALKHMCAEMLVQVELAHSALLQALESAGARAGDLPSAATIAKTLGADAFFRCSSDNIQLHGGIGFTWEHPAHLYLRRAKAAQLLLGDAAAQRARLADLLDAESS